MGLEAQLSLQTVDVASTDGRLGNRWVAPGRVHSCTTQPGLRAQTWGKGDGQASGDSPGPGVRTLVL